MVHGQVGDNTNGVHRYPLPEHALLGHVVGLHFALHLDVEYLQGFARFKRNHLRSGMHDGRVGGDGPAYGIGRVVQVNDDHLTCLVDFLAHAYKFVGFHGKRAKSDVGHVDARILELQVFLELYG